THLPVKTALLRPFTSILLSRPAWADLVKWTVVALPPLANGLKIIDFPGESSFATASSDFRL
ncbi:MAG: hypothetical protein KGJ02_03645, partial [Verrucomicrobiota bacterium]|nr:hypothetical protein [Verrucomicrobiota bacterium]